MHPTQNPPHPKHLRRRAAWALVLLCVGGLAACEPPAHLTSPALQPRPQRTDVPTPPTHTSKDLSPDLLISEDVTSFVWIRSPEGLSLLQRIHSTTPTPSARWATPSAIHALGLRTDTPLAVASHSPEVSLWIGTATKSGWSPETLAKHIQTSLEPSQEDVQGTHIVWLNTKEPSPRTVAAHITSDTQTLVWVANTPTPNDSNHVRTAALHWLSSRAQPRLWMSPRWSLAKRNLGPAKDTPLVGWMHQEPNSQRAYPSWIERIFNDIYQSPWLPRWDTQRIPDGPLDPLNSFPLDPQQPCQTQPAPYPPSAVWSASPENDQIALEIRTSDTPSDPTLSSTLHATPLRFISYTHRTGASCGPNPLLALFTAPANTNDRAPRIQLPYTSPLDGVSWGPHIAVGSLAGSSRGAFGARNGVLRHPSVHDGWVAMEASSPREASETLRAMARSGALERRVEDGVEMYDWFRTTQRFATMCVVGRWVIAAKPNQSGICRAVSKPATQDPAAAVLFAGLIDGLHSASIDGRETTHSVRWVVSRERHNRVIRARLWGGSVHPPQNHAQGGPNAEEIPPSADQEPPKSVP